MKKLTTLTILLSLALSSVAFGAGASSNSANAVVGASVTASRVTVRNTQAAEQNPLNQNAVVDQSLQLKRTGSATEFQNGGGNKK
jgi:hypothetical protein